MGGWVGGRGVEKFVDNNTQKSSSDDSSCPVLLLRIRRAVLTTPLALLSLNPVATTPNAEDLFLTEAKPASRSLS